MAVLYRKYRSKTLAELVGQEHITAGLSAAIKAGNIAHAYLLTGPRGTGKTSVARIIAHEVNGFDYDDPCGHLDIIEIDAASNRRIDEIRELRDKINIAPSAGKYKVYIIDEVHMLTKEAFNALLKTLEEPPAHAIFILATTEYHKVPETIISRTQRYGFRPIDKAKIVEHLARLAKSEKIEAEPAALELIAEHANGGFRDAISLLDQSRHATGNVTTLAVEELLGIPPSQVVGDLWQMVKSGQNISDRLSQAESQGHDSGKIIGELINLAISESRVELARKLLSAGSSANPSLELQLIALENQPNTDAKESIEEKPSSPEPKPVSPDKVNDPSKAKPKPQPADKPPEQAKKPAAKPGSDKAHETWNNILEQIKQAGHAVYGPLRLAEAEIADNVLKIGLKFPFHIKRVSEPANLKVISDAAQSVTGQQIGIEVTKLSFEPPTVQANKAAAEEPEDAKELMNDPLSIVRNVFGDAELL